MIESTGILMHKDLQVAELLFVNAHPVEVKKVINQEHLPPGVDSAEAIVIWLEGRNMPFDRPFCEDVLRKYEIKSGSDFAGVSHNASITDCYWFADPEELQEGIQWKDVNLRNLEWSMCGEALFAGHPEGVEDLESPDFSTGGFLPKVWMREPDNIFLLKRDAYEGLNVFAEIASSEVARLLNISHVPYFFSVTSDEICSGCPCIITSDEEEMISFSMLKKDIGSFPDYMEQLGFSGEYSRMQVFDFLIGNNRMLSDISLVRSPDTLEVYGMAPLYDNGNAFFTEQSNTEKKMMMETAKKNIAAMEHIRLDENEIYDILNRISKEIEVEDIIQTYIDTFMKRVKLYNQLIK